MELLILLIAVVVVGGAVMAVIAGLGGFALVSAESRSRQKAERDAPAILDRVFDGSPVVTYNTRPAASLAASRVVGDGVRRGYKLIHDDDGILTLARETDERPTLRTNSGRTWRKRGS